jgi:hypothetical protein
MVYSSREAGRFAGPRDRKQARRLLTQLDVSAP